MGELGVADETQERVQKTGGSKATVGLWETERLLVYMRRKHIEDKGGGGDDTRQLDSEVGPHE